MQKAVVVAVADARGELICFARMDGASVSSIAIAMNKAWTAARAGKPTQEIGEKVRHPEKGHDIAYYGDPRFVGWGGGSRSSFMAKWWVPSPSVGLSSIEDIGLAALRRRTARDAEVLTVTKPRARQDRLLHQARHRFFRGLISALQLPRSINQSPT